MVNTLIITHDNSRVGRADYEHGLGRIQHFWEQLPGLRELDIYTDRQGHKSGWVGSTPGIHAAKEQEFVWENYYFLRLALGG